MNSLFASLLSLCPVVSANINLLGAYREGFRFSTELKKVADQMKNAHLSCFSKGELCELKNGKFHQPKNLPLLDQDLNFLPCCSVAISKGSENQMKESCEPGWLQLSLSKGNVSNFFLNI